MSPQGSTWKIIGVSYDNKRIYALLKFINICEDIFRVLIEGPSLAKEVKVCEKQKFLGWANLKLGTTVGEI